MTVTRSRSVRATRYLFTLLFTALLAACGGGGDGSGGTTPTTTTFTVGGSVSGLAGTGLVLQNNAGNNLTVAVSGTFSFSTAITSGGAYAVSVLTQPSAPSQTCTVANGTGTVSANVTNVTVTCVTRTFTVSASVSGLTGTGQGLVVQNNAGNTTTIGANGNFMFTAPVASGTTYAVTVLTQPSGPAQVCTVASGTGTVTTANVTNVAITCAPPAAFTVGGSASGMVGTGLVLQNNGGDNRTITGNGAFSFASPVVSGANYAVTVLTQPSSPAQVCTVASGTGTVTTANVTNVAITCAPPAFTVAGTINGYSGSGLVLQLNTANNLTVAPTFTSFSFATTPIVSGGTYAVTVLTQPSSPTQICAVTNGSGTISANVVNVVVTCTTSTFTIGGTITGLTGTGLVLQNNGGNNLNGANGAFTFSTAVASGQPYAVSVLTQPTSPAQTCTVSNGSGTMGGAAVTNVAVTCADTTYTVGGTVSGLTGTGLVLQNNTGNNLVINASGSFTFSTALANGSGYAVTVLMSPNSPTQSCVVANGSGTIAAANVTNVTVTCSTNTYTIGGAVTGLTGSTGLVIQINGGSNITLNADGPFTFPALPSGAAYAVAVLTPPNPAKVCSVARGVGIVGGANVTNVAIVCSTTTFTIGGTINGLPTGTTAVLQNNGTNNLIVAANGSFTFATSIASGSDYLVTVLTNPVSPARACDVTTGSGTAIANVTTVVVTCRSRNAYISNALGDDGIGTFTIGGSGSLSAGTHYTTAPDDANGVAVTPTGSHLFASVGGTARMIKVYVVDHAGPELLIDSGHDIAVPAITDPSNPKNIFVHPSENYVYVFDAPNGAIRIYHFDKPTSTLSSFGYDTVAGLFAVVMRPQGNYLYAASYDFSNVTPFSINGANGSISSNPPTAAIGSPGAEMALAMDPQGRFLFAAQQRDELLNAYTIDAGTGALTLATSLSTAVPPVALGIRALAVDSTGRFLYGTNGDGNILGYSIDQQTGVIAPMVGSPFTASGSAAGLVTMTVESSGKYLYKLSAADGTISIFSINSTTGALTEVGGSPFLPANGGSTAIALE